jgi:hypothetical protein
MIIYTFKKKGWNYFEPEVFLKNVIDDYQFYTIPSKYLRNLLFKLDNDTLKSFKIGLSASLHDVIWLNTFYLI